MKIHYFFRKSSPVFPGTEEQFFSKIKPKALKLLRLKAFYLKNCLYL